MRKSLAYLVGALLLFTLVGCDRSAEQRRAEEAVNRGDAPTAVQRSIAIKTFEKACTKAGGIWQEATVGCGMSAAMCPAPAEWEAATGCVLKTVPVADCVDMANVGAHVVAGVCAITSVSSEQFEQLGLVGEH